MARGEKRVRERVPKAERRDLRLWAEGQREQMLLPHLDAYSKALDQGWSEERKYMKKICKEFHARIDWRTEDHEEPALKDFDPKAVIPPVVLEPAEEVEMQARKKVLDAVSHSCYTVTFVLPSLSVYADGSSIASASFAIIGLAPLLTPPRTPSLYSSPNSPVSPLRRRHDKLSSNSCTSHMPSSLPQLWRSSGLRNWQKTPEILT